MLLTAAPQGVAADSSVPRVTFSASRATATLVGHWSVDQSAMSASAQTKTSSTAAAQTEDLSPKAQFADSAATAAGRPVAPTSDVNVPSLGSDDFHTPRPAESFMGQQASNITCSYFPKGCNPPDMALAASPSRVLQGVNTQWTVYDTSGHALLVRSAQKFFGVPSNTCDPAANGQPFLSDPRALYDPSTGRFWAAMLQLEGALGVGGNCPLLTVYYVAVSQTHDPSGAWNVYEFDMSLGTTNVADFTQLGLNGDAVFFSANMFNQAGTAYEYAELFEANKHQMQEGEGGFTAAGFFNLQAHGPAGDFLADTVNPALNLDMSSSEYFGDTFDAPDPVTGHLCGSAADSCRGLALWRMANATGHDHGGSLPTLTGTYVPNIKPYTFPPASDEPGCARCVDASDLRISGTPVVRNSRLYAAWETGINNGTTVVPGIEWAQIYLPDAGRFSGGMSGYYNFTNHASASYPALMPDDHGSLTMIFDYMSGQTNPQVRYVVRPGPAGNFQGRGVLLKSGEAPYRPGLCGSSALPVCRWGDYSAASFDGGLIWVAGEYTNAFTDPNAAPVFGRNWGTWIAAVPS